MTEPDERETGPPAEYDPEGTPCCTGCGRPYVKGQYYCQHCGTAVGNITPYVPYVNIPFNFGPFVDVWKVIKGEREVSVGKYVGHLLLAAAMFPLILLVGVPFVIARWIAGDRNPDHHPDEEST
jgi:hypothetical protein